jgi:hypothetical protein
VEKSNGWLSSFAWVGHRMSEIHSLSLIPTRLSEMPTYSELLMSWNLQCEALAIERNGSAHFPRQAENAGRDQEA